MTAGTIASRAKSVARPLANQPPAFTEVGFEIAFSNARPVGRCRSLYRRKGVTRACLVRLSETSSWAISIGTRGS
jgi:hypothetical protein